MMKNARLLLLLWAIALAFGSSMSAIAQSEQRHLFEDPIPGVLYVKYEQGASPDLSGLLDVQRTQPAFPSIEMFMAKRQLPSSVLDLHRIHRVQYGADISPQEAAEIMASQPGVIYAEPIFPASPTGLLRGDSPSSRLTEATETRGMLATPNDPLFQDIWYMRRLRITEAWDHVKGEDGDVVIAIVDGGTDWRHEDLRANVWTNPGEIAGNGVDDDRNGYVDDVHGWNFRDGTGDPTGSGFAGRHGTSVAGIAAAVANNGKGLAGTSWNAKFMPINTACPDSDNFCSYLEGLLYAAANGADIATASFAGFISSQTQADIIKAVTEMGMLVIAGASNERIHMDYFLWYPAGLPETLSVCGTEYFTDRNYYNYGYTIDVCMAGRSVTATDTGDRYGSVNGTSYAVPLVAGVAALVKTAYPDFSAEQVREQLRATATNIDASNPPTYAGLLGRGAIDAYKAVTERDAVSARLTDWTAIDASGDGYIAVGELVTVNATITNYLAAVNGYMIDWTPNGPYFDMVSGSSVTTGPLGNGESVEVQFSFRPRATVPYRHRTFIEPRIRPLLPSGIGDVISGGDAVRLITNDTELVTHRTSFMSFDVTQEGNFGYVDVTWVSTTDYPGRTGQGFKAGPNGFRAVEEAGLAIGAGIGRVSGSVSEVKVGFEQNRNFEPNGPMEMHTPASGQQLSRVRLKENATSAKLGLDILQETFTDTNPRFQNVAIVRYTLHNPTDASINNLHVGLFFNWDLGEWWLNTVAIDAQEGITYTKSNDGDGKDLVAGLKVITPGANVHSRSYNWVEVNALSFPHQLWDGLSGGVNAPDEETQDRWAQIVSAGPYDIPAGADTTVAFAILTGETLSDLQTGAREAVELLRLMNNEGPTTVTAPSAPSGLTATASGRTRTDLFWMAPSNTGGAAITGYRIEVSLNAGTSWTDLVGNTGNAATTYVHTGLAPGTTRYYRVSAINSAGTGPASNVASATTKKGVGLVANPERIDPFAEGTSESFTVKLSEAPSGDVTVTLSVLTNSHVPVTIKPASLTLTFSSTDWNTAQTVTVTHTDNSTVDGDGWVIVELTAAGGGADGSIGQVDLFFTDNDGAATPSAPTGLSAVASGQTQIDLYWTAPSNTGGAAITGYRIEVSLNAGTSWTDLVGNTGSAATSYAHTGLSAGTTRHYRVSAINSGGISPASNVASATTKKGVGPVVNPAGTIGLAEGTSESFTVVLNAAPSGDVTVTLSVRPAPHVPVTIKPASLTLTFTPTNWQMPQTVTVTHTEDNIKQGNGWVVVDLEAAGGGADGSIGQVDLFFTDNDGVVTAPLAPRDLAATASGRTQIDLSWSAPLSNGGAAITGYRIEVSWDAGMSWTGLEAATGSAATTYAHTGLSAGTTRHYRVSAINSAGTSPASNVASATTGAGLVVNQEIISPFAEGTSESFTVKLSEAPSGGVTVTLSVRTNSHVPVTIKPASLTLTFSSTDWNTAQTVTVTHTDNSTADGNGWVVVDLAAAGGGVDGSIGQVNLYFTDNDGAVTAPLAPTGLGAAASGQTQIDLSWTAPSNTGGAAITGYRIEVSSNAGTSWTDLEANTGSAATTYAHTGLAPGTTRHYRVSAINTAGTSPASNVASATTETVTSVDTPPQYTLRLDGNHPNPFSARTTISFTLPEPAVVTMDVHDLLGRQVLTVGPDLRGGGPGILQVEGNRLAPGVYLYRIHARTPTVTSILEGKLIKAR